MASPSRCRNSRPASSRGAFASSVADRVSGCGEVETLISNINVDYSKGIEAVQHIVSLGHQRVGFISGPLTLKSAWTRCSAFLKCISACGISEGQRSVVEGNHKIDGGEVAMTRLLSLATDRSAHIQRPDCNRSASCHYPRWSSSRRMFRSLVSTTSNLASSLNRRSPLFAFLVTSWDEGLSMRCSKWLGAAARGTGNQSQHLSGTAGVDSGGEENVIIPARCGTDFETLSLSYSLPGSTLAPSAAEQM